MKSNRTKILTIAILTIPLLAVAVFTTPRTQAVPNEIDVVVVYKTKCALCHKPDASKLFDVTLSETELVEAVMKGKKGVKPPNMPAFEDKGITEADALALVNHMKELRGVTDPPANTNTESVGANCNTADTQ